MKLLSVLTALVSLAAASPVSSYADASASNGQAVAHASTSNAPTDLPRLIVYFQTTHDSNGNPISALPLVQEKGIALTHFIACSLHVNKDGVIHLNDYPPSDDRFKTLWKETQVLKQAGVKIMGMVGGAAAGSFTSDTLDGSQDNFDHYYGQLKDVITQFGLDGMDLDVEQSMSQSGINRLIDALYSDFGSSFIITLAPVASALSNGSNLSGFNYKTLDQAKGSKISFYNAQFYSGFGSMASTSDYTKVVNNGFKPERVIAGQLTSRDNGYGYIPYTQLNSTIIKLRKQYGQIGGVMGWEYYNSAPGGTQEPWKWAQIMTEILRPNSVPKMKITRNDADELTRIYKIAQAASKRKSFAASDASGSSESGSSDDSGATVNYYDMINA